MYPKNFLPIINLATVALSLLLTLQAASAEPVNNSAGTTKISKTNSPLDRIVIIGASASAGFTAAEPFGGPMTEQYHLDRYVNAALLCPHEPVRNFSSALFFMQAPVLGRQQIEQASALHPTMVLGIDFLFWFCYGEGKTTAERLRRFEQGLKLVDALSCPLVLGDIPDASAALGRMLSQDEIPAADAIDAANHRLQEWAASRPRVTVLSLSRFMRTAVGNKELDVHGYKWAAGKTQTLLQEDYLHPSPTGCIALTLAAFDAFQSSNPKASTKEICWNPGELATRAGVLSPNRARPLLRQQPGQTIGQRESKVRF